MCQMLEYASAQRVRISQIIQHVNLTTEQTNDFLKYLIDRNMMDRECKDKSGRCIYRTTSKGIKYLKELAAISEMMKELARTAD